MKLNTLAIVGGLIAFTATSAAQVQCPTYAHAFEAQTTIERQILVRSDAAQIIGGQQASFQGNVLIATPQSTIYTDSATIEENGAIIRAAGDVRYLDPMLKVDSIGVEANTPLKLLQMNSTEYQLNNLGGRGGAELLSISEAKGLLLEDVSFTTCPKGGEDWKILAS